MGKIRTALFVGLALGYAGVGFVVGREVLHSVLGIEPGAIVPVPGILLQLVGFATTFIIVVGLTIVLMRLLSLDKM